MAMAKKRHWATVGEESGCTFLCLYDEDDSVGPDHDEVISFCPNCGFPLREDGELKVGNQGWAETSNPRENGDTLEGGEG
jgi:hypothetical protein